IEGLERRSLPNRREFRMVSLRPKEGGGIIPPGPPAAAQGRWIPVAIAVAILAILGIAYTQHSANSSLEGRIVAVEHQNQQLQDDLKKAQSATADLASDLEVVSKKMGVTNQDLAESRKFAEKLRQDAERSRAQLAKELEAKANTTDVADVREEATTKVAAAQKDADTKIGGVSNDVKTVATNLEATKQDLAASRREITDVKTTLSQQIARNSSELSDLRRKGERD